jgi:hypothetical protein
MSRFINTSRCREQQSKQNNKKVVLLNVVHYNNNKKVGQLNVVHYNNNKKVGQPARGSRERFFLFFSFSLSFTYRLR